MNDYSLIMDYALNGTRLERKLDYFIISKHLALEKYNPKHPIVKSPIGNSDHNVIDNKYTINHPIALKQIEIFS